MLFSERLFQAEECDFVSADPQYEFMSGSMIEDTVRSTIHEYVRRTVLILQKIIVQLAAGIREAICNKTIDALKYLDEQQLQKVP